MVDIYIDAYAGDDNNNLGLDPASPLKTLQAGIDMIPVLIRDNIVLHLSGIFEDKGEIVVQKIFYVYPSLFPKLIIDGGDGYVALSGPHTADIHNTSAIGLSSLSLEVDTYEGLIIQILDGPAAGESRMVFSNDATTFTPSKDWTVDPGTAKFQIVRPATEIRGNAPNECGFTFSCAGKGEISIQRLYLSGSRAHINAINCQTPVVQSQIVNDSTCDKTFFSEFSTDYTYSTGNKRDPDIFGAIDLVEDVGVSQRNPVGKAQFVSTGFSGSAGGHARNMEFRSCDVRNDVISKSSRIRGKLALNSTRLVYPAQFFGDTECVSLGYRKPQVDGAIILVDSQGGCTLDGATIINASGHGIELNRSTLKLQSSDLDGYSTGAGVYAHDQSSVHLLDGYLPTISGTVGDISVDGTAEAVTWGDVDSGTVVSDTSEFTIIKKVS